MRMSGFKPLSVWLGMMIVGCLGIRPCQAALQFDVFVGHGNVVREASWIPVTCEVMNDGPAFVGTIEISPTHMGGGERRRLVLDLPTNTRKRVVISVFNSGGGIASWDGRLYDESGKLRSEQPGVRVREVSFESVLMGAMARTFAGAPKFPVFRQSNSNMKPEVGRIMPEQFPNTSIALESLSSLYVNSEQALKLNQDQASALTEWVAGGGHLILAVEQPADLRATTWLQPLSPFVPEGVSTVEVGATFFDWLASVDESAVPLPTVSSAMVRNALPSRSRNQVPGSELAYRRVPRELSFESETLPVVTGNVVGGEVLLRSGESPLVVSGKRGRGQVTVLAFSPEREPFSSWKSRPWFWAKLNRIPEGWFEAPRFNSWGGESVDGVFGSLIESRQVRKLPVKWLLLLLVVYLVVIGPFDHWWLKKINRQMLTWITFPIYVVVFSLLIYFIGYRLRAGELEWNEFHLVDVLQQTEGQARLRGRSYSAIYSPSNARYQVGCGEPTATFRPEFHGASSGGQSGIEAEILTGDAGLQTQFFVPVWTSQLHVTEWTHSGSMPLSVRITRDGGAPRVEIRNQGERQVEQLWLVSDGQIRDLGELGGGDTVSEPVAGVIGTPLETFVVDQSRSYQHALSTRKDALGETFRLDGLETHSAVCSFLSLLPEEGNGNRNFLFPRGTDLSAHLQRGDVVVMAFVPDYAPVPELNRFKVSRASRGTLVRFVLPVEPGAGAM